MHLTPQMNEISPQSESTPSMHELSLLKIASWSNKACPVNDTSIRASVPALQRGLVWEPQQVEMLWDSILRGFPIGALVICKRVDELKLVHDDKITHHLLDGQQRCNAISLGFKDTFKAPKQAAGKFVEDSILWLDLNPERDANSTRNYLTRITTLAHPWGYRQDDDAKRMKTQCIRNALEAAEHKNLAACDYRRPKPVELWPHIAKAPIPLAWLMNASLKNEAEFWRSVRGRIDASVAYKWIEPILKFLADTKPKAVEQRRLVYRGIQHAAKARIIALEAPEEILEASMQEGSQGTEKEDISNIEHLFQRLNRLGTRLDGEELAYSMIKAYWPKIAPEVNEIAAGLMPQSRLFSLAVRAALSANEHKGLPGVVGVSALRNMVKNQSDKFNLIQKYIKENLKPACAQVSDWLRYSADKEAGLLPVHVTSIAQGSPELYLLLLTFADRTPAGSDTDWEPLLPGLATALHWFAKDKGKVTNRIYLACHEELSLKNIKRGISNAIEAEEMCSLHAPLEVDEFIQIPDKDLAAWNWGHLIEGDKEEVGMAEREKSWRGFLNFVGNRELLLYVQRAFIAKRFPEYDPARRDLWEAHNRPWDFDHILAHKYFYNHKRDNTYMAVCAQWGNTIGNLRAWAFEDNRSDQYVPAICKIGENEMLLDASFVEAEEIPVFSSGDDVCKNEASARKFIEICRCRLLRIYKRWYSDSGIAQLFPPEQKQ